MKIAKKKFIKIVREELVKALQEQVTIDQDSKPQNSKTIRVGPDVPQEVPQMLVGDDQQPFTIEFPVPDGGENVPFKAIFLKPRKTREGKEIAGPQSLVVKNEKARIHVFPMINNGKPLYSLVQSKAGRPVYKNNKLHPTPEGAVVEYFKLVLQDPSLEGFISGMRPEAQQKYNNAFGQMRTWDDQRWLKYLKFQDGESFHGAMVRALQQDGRKRETVPADDDTIIVYGKRPKPNETNESISYIQKIIKEETTAVLLEQASSETNEKFLVLQQALMSDPPDIIAAREHLSALGSLLQDSDQIPG